MLLITPVGICPDDTALPSRHDLFVNYILVLGQFDLMSFCTDDFLLFEYLERLCRVECSFLLLHCKYSKRENGVVNFMGECEECARSECLCA